MEIFKIFLIYFTLCCLLAGGTIAYVEYLDTIELENRLFYSKYPENFILADELCRFYGFNEAKNIIVDGRKIKMLCEH